MGQQRVTALDTAVENYERAASVSPGFFPIYFDWGLCDEGPGRHRCRRSTALQLSARIWRWGPLGETPRGVSWLNCAALVRRVSDRRIVMISGSFEYDSEESLVLLRDYLRANAPMESELIAFDKETDDVSLAPIDTADAVVLFTRRLETQGLELERFQRYCTEGRPLVALRTASHAFQHWLHLDELILGGHYEGHFGSNVTTDVRHAEEVQHRILDQVEPFAAYGALYRNTPLATDTTALLLGRAGNEDEPVAWTCERAGRVFTTSLGHQRDFWELDFLRLLENSLRWACDIERA